jgi:hypothetical protein
MNPVQIHPNAAEVVPVKEVQDLVHDHTGGTFTISFNGEATSSSLDFDDDGTGISAYLETFSYQGVAITVTVVENATGDWTITFDTPLADVPEIVVETNLLTGGSTIDLTETTPGIAAYSDAHRIIGGDKLGISIDVTAITGTVDFTVEWSPDGVRFGDADTADTLAQIAGVATASKSFDVKAPYFRLVWTIGTGPVTFTAAGVN